jgi:hypothetical protein
MHTKDKLAAALRDVGLDAMAEKAAAGYYHDFLSPLELPALVLVTNLGAVATENPDKAEAIEALRRRVTNGDFDASPEEGEEWANSPEGQDTMRRLMRGTYDR